MRALGWGAIAALTLLAGAAVAAAQPPASKAMPGGWWNDLFGPAKPKEPTKDEAKAPKPPSPEQRQVEYDRLLKALQRRQEVCTRLREIGIETQNAALLQEAERLDDLAFRIFKQQSDPLLGIQSRRTLEENEEELLRPSGQGLVPARMGAVGSGPRRTGEAER
jgi:hypothetical protein